MRIFLEVHEHAPILAVAGDMWWSTGIVAFINTILTNEEYFEKLSIREKFTIMMQNENIKISSTHTTA